MSNKKGMELPQSVVIVALILIVLVIIILVFVVGGFGKIGEKLNSIFGTQTEGQSKDLAISTCQGLCQTAKVSGSSNSAYCTQTFKILDARDAKTIIKYKCGEPAKVADADSLGIDCPDINC